MKAGTSDLAYWLGRGDADPGTGSPYERYLLISLLCLGLIILYRRRVDWYKTIKENAWMMVLILFMFLSMLWTEVPFMTVKRWVRELVVVVMALVIFSEDNPRNAVESVLRRSIYILIPLSFLLVIFYPEYGTKPFGGSVAWIGMTNHKNGLGRLCYIATFFLVCSFINRRIVHNAVFPIRYEYAELVVLTMAIYLLKGPGMGKAVSITSLITLAVGLASFFGLLLAKRFKRYLSLSTFKFVIVGIIIVGTASAFIGGLVFGGEIASSFGREETLTGRTQIWAELIPFVMREPIIGHGIDGFFTNAMQKSLGNLPHAHNGYLGVILVYGFVGLLLVSIFFISSCKKARQLMDHDYLWGGFCLCFLIMSLIHNIAEPSIDTFTTQQMAIILFLTVSSASISEDKPILAKDFPKTEPLN
jgi:O-antigen ligase